MKVTVLNSQVAQQIVIEELAKFAERDLRITTAIKVKKMYNDIQSIIEDNDKHRLELFKKYAQMDENGNFVHPVNEATNEVDHSQTKLIEGKEQIFYDEMNSLMKMEHVLSVDKIKMSELGDINISVKTLSILEFIFEDDLTKEQ